MRKRTKWIVSIIAALLTLLMATSVFAPLMMATDGVVNYGSSPSISLLDNNSVKVDTSKYYDGTKIQKLPENVKDTDDISLIIEMPGNTLLDTYDTERDEMTFTEYFLTSEAAALRADISAMSMSYMKKLDAAGISYSDGATYDTVLSGFEITIKAGDFVKVCSALGDEVGVIVSEEYKVAETQLVENRVNVYGTGIFNSSDFGYDGTGMVVAVLDTGLDYTHTAFSMDNFTAAEEDWGLTFEMVDALLGGTNAATNLAPGISAEDVFVSGKVPFGFDYADGDTEVFPINSEHGTHVAGVIAGKDDTITGVAPNAQVVVMKTFSDLKATAYTSWILSAVEDCVALGVDVINMSLGVACGFTRNMDAERENKAYDRVREEGISLVVACSNSYNSTFGSEKNGNLGLTSNPDSATVGSPATYLASLAVASIEGVKTPYLLFGETIIYFDEATDRISEEKSFLEDLLKNGKTEATFEYVTIPGVGRRADYTGIDIKGKIALVSRGNTTFEEKANTAELMGAAGIIIYNNVSGEIKMNVGDTKIAVCSISQDDGELLAAQETGTIKVSFDQVSGPFMSDFSSWGPTPDLKIKPEITAHGGSILSAVPGQDYDRISGTSMASPNVAGAVALLRQYVTSENSPFSDEIKKDPVAVTATVNRLLMSTADITYNKNGLPYSVRKQGAGLANLISSRDTGALILTYDRETGEVMDKSKIELGDDPSKTGVYVLNFSIDNFGSSAVSYDLSAHVMTEGVSETPTKQGENTVTETGYILNGAKVEITSISGGDASGMNITVGAGKKADVTVTITLSDEDKKYLNDSFENGMYVEGYIILDAADEEVVDLSVPYLAFYGDWSQAPLFDLDYFATDKDAMDDSIDTLDKTLPDGAATTPIGGLYDDFISYLGSYYFIQDPSTKLISADRKYSAITNDANGINSLKYIWAGMLRGAERVEITIVEDSTGEVVFSTTEYDIRKSHNNGGSIRISSIDVKFNSVEHDLKNNTQYTVTMKGYLDWGEDGGAETNVSNEFSFPLYSDFQAPAVTDCEFYTEYDKTTKSNRLYAKLAVYDNHYAMSTMFGYVGLEYSEEAGKDQYTFKNFDHYQKQVYSDFNSTTYVVYELTDHLEKIKANGGKFSVVTYDYALNQGIYEIALPTAFRDIAFNESSATLSVNQTYDIIPNISVYPGSEWAEMVDFSTSDENVIRVVGGKVLATGRGEADLVATVTVDGKKSTAKLHFTVLGEGDEGYKRYDPPQAEDFYLVGYKVNKAFFFISGPDRDIGATGEDRKFTSQNNYSLKMFPSESVTIDYYLSAYYPDKTTVEYSSSDSKIVSVDKETGEILAVAKGYATVTAKVLIDGKSTYYTKSISIEVKDPYVTMGPQLNNYYGNGGVVEIPEGLSITTIGQFAFSNYDYYPRAEEDITEEDPSLTEIGYIGENTITKVIIPEGVESIGPYAFANLSALEEVVLPSTLKTIDKGAFYNCKKLTKVVGLENVKFINQNAFAYCDITGFVNFGSAVAIADHAFYGNANIDLVSLAASTQSIGAYAFAGNTGLEEVRIAADKLKLSEYVFSNCTSLSKITINAQVIPTGAFNNCTSLKDVTIGKDVMLISQYAFRNTAVESFSVAEGNSYLYPVENKPYLVSSDSKTLILVAPAVSGEFSIEGDSITAIAAGAFSGNENITSVKLPAVKSVGAYAFAQCHNLKSVTLGALTEIGDHAFEFTAITEHPSFAGVSKIGAYAFAKTPLTKVVIPGGVPIGDDDFKVTIGDYAFNECGVWEKSTYLDNGKTVVEIDSNGDIVYVCKRGTIASITIGDNVSIGEFAFSFNGSGTVWTVSRDSNGYYYYDPESALTELSIGKRANIGRFAFYCATDLGKVSLGEGATIGEYAFYNAMKLTDIDLSKVVFIGDGAFSGQTLYKFTKLSGGVPSEYAKDKNGNPILVFCAAPLVKVDLSSATYIGKQAFYASASLEEVILGDGIDTIELGTFYGCISLKKINLEKVKTISDYAFTEAPLTFVDLSACESVGMYAFIYCQALEGVAFGDSISFVGEAAFANCSKLKDVKGLEKVKTVSDYAFAYTALTRADLSGAEYIGDHAFAKIEMTDFTVVLGKNITDIGENPFTYCRISPLSITVTEVFDGKEYFSSQSTYNLGEKICIINGSIYKRVPNGLELITYCGNDKSVTVAEGTVRITAYAFAGAKLESVILPYTLKAIGDKAFFDCDNLAVVSFSGYYAPILEEQYDIYYYLEANFAGNIPNSNAENLGIIDFGMWTADLTTNTYFGANFKDYIGHITNKMTMVRPVNGVNYDSFIFEQYFSTVINGAAGADNITLEAIDIINRLPEKLTLADKAAVEAARAAYDRIVNNEQRALAADVYSKLTDAEKKIATLEYLENEGKEPTPEEPNEPTPEAPDAPEKTTLPAVAVAGIILGAVVALAAMAVIAIYAVRFIKQKRACADESSDEGSDGESETENKD